MPDVGEEWIYRLRDDAPSERVRIVEIDERKKTPRYVIEFLDGDNAGTRDNVPPKRLRGPWVEVVEYDTLMANWKRIDCYQLTDSEEAAVEQVFLLLIAPDVAEWEWGRVKFATRIYDTRALQEIIGIPVHYLRAQTESFELDDDILVSPDATLLIAELACRLTPMPVLDWVMEDEKEYRHRSKHGKPAVDVNSRAYTTSPEQEYQWYLKRGRPVHELLRSWCGQRAATLQERLGAAEAENRRLEELIERIFAELKRLGHAQAVDYLARGYEEDRITPETFRPVVDRPLKPEEIPVRYVTAPRRWRY